MQNKIELRNSKKRKILKLLENDATKRDRQKLVKLLVRVKKTQRKLVIHSTELSNCLSSMPPALRQWISFSVLSKGRDPNEAIDQLIDSSKVFIEGMNECRKRIKIARKRVKNKDYKDE